MPELIRSRDLSLIGTSGNDGSRRCPFDSKNARYFSRRSLSDVHFMEKRPFMFTSRKITDKDSIAHFAALVNRFPAKSSGSGVGGRYVLRSPVSPSSIAGAQTACSFPSTTRGKALGWCVALCDAPQQRRSRLPGTRTLGGAWRYVLRSPVSPSSVASRHLPHPGEGYCGGLVRRRDTAE